MSDTTINYGKSPQEVAFTLWERIQTKEGNTRKTKDDILNLYAECLEATMANRTPK
ncbi:MAG: hypothetical protein P1V21_01280 [Rhizobiaceae bacterium]|nr:hypothetical protein [Rhizobiaceae bacterium]